MWYCETSHSVFSKFSSLHFRAEVLPSAQSLVHRKALLSVMKFAFERATNFLALICVVFAVTVTCFVVYSVCWQIWLQGRFSDVSLKGVKINSDGCELAKLLLKITLNTQFHQQWDSSRCRIFCKSTVSLVVFVFFLQPKLWTSTTHRGGNAEGRHFCCRHQGLHSVKIWRHDSAVL